MTLMTKPLLLNGEEGQHVWYGGGLITIKLTGAETNGVIGLADTLLPVGFATPFHVHANEDEIYYIVEGEAEYLVGGKLQKATAGAVVFLPRNVPHGFRVVGAKPARILNWVTPAGFEQMFVEAGEPALSLTLPAPAMPNIEKIMEITRAYGLQVLGPLHAEIAKIQ